MMKAYKKPVATCILGKVNKTGVTVFQYIVHQFLYYPENYQFIFCFQPFPVIMETTAGIHASRTTDLLKKVIDRRLQTKIFQGGRHQAVGNVADQLDGIINDLFGIVDTLQLCGFV